MSRLTLSYSDIYKKVSEFLGLGSSPSGTDLTNVEAITARGYRDFLYPIDLRSGQKHDWNFLKQYYTFSTTSGQYMYALPIDFSDLLDDIHYDTGKGFSRLIKRNAEQIKEMKATFDNTSYPELYAVTPSRYDLEIGTVYELWLYPTPGQAYTLVTFYRIDPLKPVATGDDAALLVGGIRATEAILECCLAAAELEQDDVIGIHSQKANELIQKLIVADTITNSDYIGNLYRDVDGVWPSPRGEKTYPNVGNVFTGLGKPPGLMI